MVFVSKMQTFIPANINEFTVFSLKEINNRWGILRLNICLRWDWWGMPSLSLKQMDNRLAFQNQSLQKYMSTGSEPFSQRTPHDATVYWLREASSKFWQRGPPTLRLPLYVFMSQDPCSPLQRHTTKHHFTFPWWWHEADVVEEQNRIDRSTLIPCRGLQQDIIKWV